MEPERVRFGQVGSLVAAAVMLATALVARVGWAEERPREAPAARDAPRPYAGVPSHGWRGPLDRGPGPQHAASDLEDEADSPEGLDGFLSEVRLGALDHDLGLFGSQRESGLNLNMELLFVAPGVFEIIWLPRPHFGVTVNTEDDTSFLYTGFTWDIANIAERTFGWKVWEPLLIEGVLGLALHNGELSLSSGQTSAKALGCRVLFREALSVGVRFWTYHSLSLSLDHISNAGICSDNDGLETLGIRYGYRF